MGSGPSSTTASAASLLDRFAVQAEVGQGASGVVFRAHDTVTDQEVALKLVLVREGVSLDPDEFMREGKLLSGIDHPAVVRTIDFGTVAAETLDIGGRLFQRGTPYLAMEWLAGQDLQRRHASQPLSLHESLEVARQLASALATMHEQRIAHRDVKPSNVFVLEPGPDDGESLTVKLVDFGVACGGDLSVTGAGPMVGTPAYMSPEQARGDADVDVRCDLYSLGATLFELVANRPPHTGQSPIATLVKLVSTPAPRLAEVVVDVPGAVDDLVADLLQQDPARRPSAREAQRRLADLVADPGLPRVAGGLELQLESVHSSTSRLVTTLVALNVATGDAREQQLAQLRERGAEAVRLGRDSIVAFLGARRAHGREA
ncbi:MAG: serine/threonine protein kinase, partial [Deltaproteobacteria bacterium]|nr:serine/threonine protein kinase [Deltaproteobacteria bacterium]MBW2537746.1 serine/threonine protein kinase [Deltaproteobacteria bacterium]